MHCFAMPPKTRAHCNSVSLYGENHGKEIVVGVTLSMTATVPNDWLANLSGHLKSAFYSKGRAAGQGEIPGTELSDAPHLRMPELGPIPWTNEYTGLTLTIDSGMGGASNIVVTDCRIDNISFAFKDGGSVEVSWKIKSSKADEATRGRLTSLTKHDVELDITPPEPGQEVVEPPAPAKKKGKTEKGPTEAFVEAVH